MHKTEKEAVVAELTERLRTSESLIVADYRGLTNAQLDGLRGKLREHGARFQIVKNTLTRRASDEAGTEALLALLEGPTAIAFVESDGDPVAVAKALADAAKETKVLTLRGGVLSGRPLTDADLEELAKLPSVDVVKSQLVGVIVAPLTQLLGLLTAPVRDLVGLIDARVAQLEDAGEGTSAGAEVPVEQPEAPEEAQQEEAEETVAEASAEDVAAVDPAAGIEGEVSETGEIEETTEPEQSPPVADE